MKKLSDLEYLKLNKFQRFSYNFLMFLLAIPMFFVNLGKGIVKFFVKLGTNIKDGVLDIFRTFRYGNWAVKLSFLVFGMGNLYYGQIMRGLFFLLFEAVFFAYMFLPSGGIHWLSKVQWFQTGQTVGTVQRQEVIEYIDYGGMKLEVPTVVPGDDSVKVLLYGLLTVAFIVAFIWTWRMQLKQCSICMDITAQGKKVKSGKDDLRSMVDDQFHKTLLALPVVGILVFTVLPIIFMVLIAFTSYDAAHDGYANLFTWVGWDHFNELFNFGSGGMGIAFGEILSWTLMWSFFATFSNYFLGMFVAMMINKKGIKLKKLWRTVLVMTIAIPQFVSLLYVSKLFDSSGILGEALGQIPFIKDYLVSNRYISLWDSPDVARFLVIAINVWVGIPFMMLQATGILMNIPADLYESARVDGASPWQQYIRVTLPYMLFVTGPALLTSFVGNLNNFNVIYLLSMGNPLNTALGTPGGASVGHTDLLITWLFKMTLGSTDSRYYMASVVGILIFVVCAVLSLIVYNIIPSTKNEEDFN